MVFGTYKLFCRAAVQRGRCLGMLGSGRKVLHGHAGTAAKALHGHAAAAAQALRTQATHSKPAMVFADGHTASKTPDLF